MKVVIFCVAMLSAAPAFAQTTIYAEGASISTEVGAEFTMNYSFGAMPLEKNYTVFAQFVNSAGVIVFADSYSPSPGTSVWNGATMVSGYFNWAAGGCPNCGGFGGVSGFDPRQYHTAGLLVTSDGSTGMAVCGYLDGVSHGCRSVLKPTAGDFSYRNFLGDYALLDRSSHPWHTRSASTLGGVGSESGRWPWIERVTQSQFCLRSSV